MANGFDAILFYPAHSNPNLNEVKRINCVSRLDVYDFCLVLRFISRKYAN